LHQHHDDRDTEQDQVKEESDTLHQHHDDRDTEQDMVKEESDTLHQHHDDRDTEQEMVKEESDTFNQNQVKKVSDILHQYHDDSDAEQDQLKKEYDTFNQYHGEDRKSEQEYNEIDERLEYQDKHAVSNEIDQPGIFDNKVVDEQHIKEFDEYYDELEYNDKIILHRDFTFKEIKPKRDIIPNSYKVQLFQSDNLFLPGDGGEQITARLPTSTRNTQEGEGTGKFGSGHKMISFGGKAPKEDTKRTSYAQQHINRKAEESIKNRYQNFSPVAQELEDRKADQRNAVNTNKPQDSNVYNEFPFDPREIRIGSFDEHSKHSHSHASKHGNPHSFTVSKGKYYGNLNYTMHDDR
jgi:hypothetical protein